MPIFLKGGVGLGCMRGNRRVGRGGRRLLLASTSVAALLIGGGAPSAFAGTCAINEVGVTVGSVTNAATTPNCINIQNSIVTGNVTNTGTGVITATGATPPTATGITINNSSIGGTISNTGTITAAHGPGNPGRQ